MLSPVISDVVKMECAIGPIEEVVKIVQELGSPVTGSNVKKSYYHRSSTASTAFSAVRNYHPC